MKLKTATWGGMAVGTLFGSMVPLLWGDSPLAFSAVIFSGIGGMTGIYVGYKMWADNNR